MKNYHYAKKFLIGYGEVDKNNKCKISSILSHLQDMATLHSKTVGFGTEEMLKLGMGWVLLSWKIEIINYPEADREIEIRTWSRGLKGLHAYRSFEILDEEQNQLVIADSSWVLYDNNNRKPIKPLESMNYGSIDRKMFDEIKIDIEVPDKIDEEIIYKVQRRDVDTNNHTNNVRYIEFALESIPEEIYEKKAIFRLEMIYKKQTFYGENLKISTTKYDENMCITIIRKENDEICTLVKTMWK